MDDVVGVVLLGVVLGAAGAGAGIPDAAPAATVRHGQPEMRPARVKLNADEVVVPMDSFGGRPVVSLMLDGRGPHRFVLDTGAAGSVMSREVADTLDLAPLGEARVGSPGGATNPGTLVRIGRVKMGGAVLRDLSLVATDLSRVFSKPDHPVGVLSALAFSGHLVTFDYPRQRITVRKGELPAGNGADIFQYEEKHHIPTLEIAVAGVPVQAHLDSGSGRGLMLPAALAETLPLGGPLEDKGKARTVDGEWPIRQAPLDGTVTIGRFALENPVVVFADGSPFGNIGYEILKGYSLTVDRKNRRFRLAESAPAEPAPAAPATAAPGAARSPG
jgi:hypothetical protein